MKQETEPMLFPGLPSLALSDLPSFLAQPSSNSAYLAVIMENFGYLDKNDWEFCNSSEEFESEGKSVSLPAEGFIPSSTTAPPLPSLTNTPSYIPLPR
nr:hypothetical protein CFP56_49960 [Quercus suber]